MMICTPVLAGLSDARHLAEAYLYAITVRLMVGRLTPYPRLSPRSLWKVGHGLGLVASWSRRRMANPLRS